MSGKRLRAVLTLMWRRRGLVLLLFGINVTVALMLALPLRGALGTEVGPTGHGRDLIQNFDLILWSAILKEIQPVLSGLAAQLFWMIPLVLVIKTALKVGLTYALQADGGRRFWPGVGRFTMRGLLLALLFAVPLVAVLLSVVILGIGLNVVFEGEAGRYWVNLVVLPSTLILFLAALNWMHDFGRIALVVGGAGVFRAWRTGMAYPFRHPGSALVYVPWFIVAVTLLVLPTVLDASLAAVTAGGVWLLFVLQQVVFLLRAAVTVGWIGSEVGYFEMIQERARPAIAAESDVVAPLSVA